MQALTARLRALALERDSLAQRVGELETALSETSLEAQNRAAEAVQLQALLDFYKRDREPVPSAQELEARAASEEVPGELPSAATQAEPAGPVSAGFRTGGPHRPAASWTAAWRAAAAAALREHGGPLHYRDLYRILAARGFAFGGKSPEATFLASLHRDRTTFQGAGRGRYWLVEDGDGEALAVAARTRRRTSRPRPIGKSKESR